ncbi:unnamed protein product [Lactuca virosa]|uniref:Uncharacterized protein n=1 Tax=Lactuca virosa TaxID=75947 RepID=A0AAU9LPU1_9ASTR|nr:unnamed protein product [Lactuca virosa]
MPPSRGADRIGVSLGSHRPTVILKLPCLVEKKRTKVRSVAVLFSVANWDRSPASPGRKTSSRRYLLLRSPLRLGRCLGPPRCLCFLFEENGAKYAEEQRLAWCCHGTFVGVLVAFPETVQEHLDVGIPEKFLNLRPEMKELKGYIDLSKLNARSNNTRAMIRTSMTRTKKDEWNPCLLPLWPSNPLKKTIS